MQRVVRTTPTVNSFDLVILSFFFFCFSQKLHGRVTRNREKKHMALVLKNYDFLSLDTTGFSPVMHMPSSCQG